MPGQVLIFKCQCGFTKENVTVGATDAHSYGLFFCFHCHTIVSLKIKHTSSSRTPKRHCSKCDSLLVHIDEKGAWGPSHIQEKFLGTPPWCIDDWEHEPDILNDGDNESVGFEIDTIRLICPVCGQYSLEFDCCGFWD